MSAIRSFVLACLGTAAILFLISVPAAIAQEAKKDDAKKDETKKEEPKKEQTISLKESQVKVDSALKADDDKDQARKQPCKVFVIDLHAGRSYRFDMVSKELDSYLRLEDAGGKELAKDDDGGGLVNARINFRCSMDGAYRVICTTFAGGVGAFTLTVQEIIPPKLEPLALSNGTAKAEGTLTAKDVADAVKTVSVCKVYGVTLTKGKSYQIDMTSKDVDSFLRIEDSAGKELASDDDSGGDHNARIQFTCPKDGDYHIIATTYFGGTGTFTVLVKEK